MVLAAECTYGDEWFQLSVNMNIHIGNDGMLKLKEGSSVGSTDLGVN